MECKKCGRPNRPVAKYCKWCGAPLDGAAQGEASFGAPSSAAANPLDVLVDKDKLKQQLAAIVDKARAKADFCRRNGVSERMQLSFVITGGVGTGKTTVAKAIAAALAEAGVLRSPVAEVVNPVSYDDWVKDIDKHAKRLGNTAVIFEEAQKLVPDGEAEEVTKLDHILQAAMRWREDGSKPVVIITGGRRLEGFFSKNPNSAAAINYHLETQDISIDGLVDIALRLTREKYGHDLTPEALQKLRRVFANDKRNSKCAKGAAGHDAAMRAYDIDLMAIGSTSRLLGPECVQGDEFVPKTIAQVLDEFNKYVGVKDVKDAIRAIATSIADDVRNGKPAQIRHHYQFLGNPGTGKTTMARIFADALNALGALPSGQLIEADVSQLVSQYVADTAQKVKEVFDSAMGGVLFIDEAYRLGDNDHGKEAVNALLTLAENNRGRIVVIIAGYTKEMGEFYQINTGIKSRFDKVINFPDYNPDELTEIFRRMVAADEGRLILAPDADLHIGNFFQKMYNTRTRTFGNAREVRTVFVNAKERMLERLNANPASGFGITMADVEGQEGKTKSVDEILAELDDMVGMDSVKSQLRKIARNVELNRRRAQSGRGKVVLDDFHFAITGSPGTGKTEVAKRLGRIFKAMGVLPKGHVVERERKSLLDSFVNSAGANMDKAVDEALGGVLFIDEAYNLIPMNNPSDKDKDGTAAVEALMTRMSNDAGKFVTVIAGYKAEIDEFIANANDGFQRRFSHRIHIPDYSAETLVEIFKRSASSEGFVLNHDAEDILARKVQEMVTTKDKNFGNAGAMKRLFKEVKERHDDRLGEMDQDPTDDQLFTIEAADIPYDAPKKVDLCECLRQLDDLVGLDSVKKLVRNLADSIIAEQKRADIEGRQPDVYMYHYQFLGNPGTGKTTVARIMGNIFYSLGLLPSNKVLEVKPSDLIVGFVGQTAPKTRQVIERSLGGVLFIDEAYGLNDGNFGTKDAAPELLTLLNDYRGKMVCVAAGYPREMAEWQATNTGLDRRFDMKVYFEDYSASELVTIFSNLLRKDGMKADDDAMEAVSDYFDNLVRCKGEGFGNAAEAVKLLSFAKINLGGRLRRMGDYQREELYTIRREDIFIP